MNIVSIALVTLVFGLACSKPICPVLINGSLTMRLEWVIDNAFCYSLCNAYPSCIWFEYMPFKIRSSIFLATLNSVHNRILASSGAHFPETASKDCQSTKNFMLTSLGTMLRNLNRKRDSAMVDGLLQVA